MITFNKMSLNPQTSLLRMPLMLLMTPVALKS